MALRAVSAAPPQPHSVRQGSSRDRCPGHLFAKRAVFAHHYWLFDASKTQPRRERQSSLRLDYGRLFGSKS
jgi:hypothetical protein